MGLFSNEKKIRNDIGLNYLESSKNHFKIKHFFSLAPHIFYILLSTNLKKRMLKDMYKFNLQAYFSCTV